jgi:hypothetical protein
MMDGVATVVYCSRFIMYIHVGVTAMVCCIGMYARSTAGVRISFSGDATACCRIIYVLQEGLKLY